MKTSLNNLIAIFSGAILLISCQQQSSVQETETTTETVTETVDNTVNTTVQYNVGDRVPNNQVCMVNNAYMGKDQFIVPFEGKTYYGCCDMCVERIPKDESVRSAVDPLTSEKVDKASAVIAMVNANGEVAYFKSEENFRQYMTSFSH